MNFEYDPEKSDSNKQKHGINFEEAQLLWADEKRVELASMNPVEERFLVIGMIGMKYWSAIITYRRNDVRIISVR